MTHYVNDTCRGCKYTDCVSVCPVDCFYEGEDILVIDPEVCIDCGVCIPECPVDAIKSDCDESIPIQEIQSWVEYNAKSSKIWPNITKMKPALKPYPQKD